MRKTTMVLEVTGVTAVSLAQSEQANSMHDADICGSLSIDKTTQRREGKCRTGEVAAYSAQRG